MPMCNEDERLTFVPRFLEGQSAISVAKVACGDLFVACLTDRGILMTFGSGASGCLGHGNNRDTQKAKIVESLLGYEITEISCGSSHVLAVSSEHELFSWGRGDNGYLRHAHYCVCVITALREGRLGNGRESKSIPQEIQLTDGLQAAKVFCGLDCSLVITLDNKLLCTGSNRMNKLAMNKGREKVDEVLSFSRMNCGLLKDMNIVDAAIGTSHCIVLNEQGAVYTFGSDKFSQLGHDSEDTPAKVSLPGGARVVMIACGDTYSIAITEGYDIYTWGKGSNGRLGRQCCGGSPTSKPDIVAVSPLYQPYVITSLTSGHGTTLITTKPLPASSFSR